MLYCVMDIVLGDAKRENKTSSALTSLWKRQKEQISNHSEWQVSGRESTEHGVYLGATEPFINQSIPSFSCNDPKHTSCFHGPSLLFLALLQQCVPAVQFSLLVAVPLCLNDSNLRVRLDIQQSSTSPLPCSPIKSILALLGSLLFQINFQISLLGFRVTFLDFFQNYIVFIAQFWGEKLTSWWHCIFLVTNRAFFCICLDINIFQ